MTDMTEAPMEPARVYSDLWYARNRIAVIERTRKRYADAVRRLSAEELAERQSDPTKAWTIRGPQWIACIEDNCGELHAQLGHHLRVRHHLIAAEYKRRPALDGTVSRYSKNASLLSLELQERLSKKRKQLRLGKRLQESGRVPPVEQLIAARGQRQMSLQYRIERRKRLQEKVRPELRGRRLQPRPQRQKVSDSRILEILALELPISEAAKRAGLSLHAFHWRAKRLGENFERSRTRRSLINSYVFNLRAWARTQKQIPTIEQIVQRHARELRCDAVPLFRDFIPCVPSLEAELRDHPEVMGKLMDPGAGGSAAVIALASRIFSRTFKRSRLGGEQTPQKVGATPKRKTLFVQAAKEYERVRSWGRVAQILVPGEYATDPRGAADRLRLGAKYHLQSTLHSSSEKTHFSKRNPLSPFL